MQVDEINSGTTIHVVCPTQLIPFLLILWWLQEPEHQQAWYWPPKPEYYVSSIRRVSSHRNFVIYRNCRRCSSVHFKSSLRSCTLIYVKNSWTVYCRYCTKTGRRSVMHGRSSCKLLGRSPMIRGRWWGETYFAIFIKLISWISVVSNHRIYNSSSFV